nr:protein O-mannosyl-transferase 1-like [Lytechinus pictus]
MPGNTENIVRHRVKQEQRRAGDETEVKEELSPAVSGEDPTTKAENRDKTAAPSLFVVTLNVNILVTFLTVLSFATRFWRLEEPRGVVFDETHFGLFTSFYMKGMFFFDVHPPLGKLLLAAVSYMAGFQGNFSFEKIGQEYPCDIPIWHLRLIPALCGSLLTPLSFYILEGMGYSQWTAALGAFLVVCDNSLLTQSRFILLDTMLLCFIMVALLALIRFNQLQDKPFSIQWWAWLTCIGVCISCSISVKYSGLFTMLVILGFIAADYWSIVGNRNVSHSHLFKETLARVVLLIIVPVVLYLSFFYMHLSVGYKTGPHDGRMSSAFQASLEGGLAKVTHGQPKNVAYGSQITLRHTHQNICWLHSHPHLYPLRYSETRGSSIQQQVTCYTFKDVNNWWVVKDPMKEELAMESPPRPVKDGDIIQLIHGTSGRRLNSHDVGAPMSPQFMEVSCYIDYNISFPSQDLWKVEIVNKEAPGEAWTAIHSHIRLVHVNTSQAIKVTGQQLPDWGFYQHEVATDRVMNQDSNIWNVEENKYSSDKEEFWDETKELSFFSKFWELQLKMLEANKKLSDDHNYKSDPMEWPFMERGIAYWMKATTNAQIHLLGNVVIWWSANVGIVVYLVVMVTYIIRQQRNCNDLTKAEWVRLFMTGALFLSWFFNYLPYFMMERTLFLHHYLPALISKVLLLAATIEIVYFHVLQTSAQRSLFTSLVVVWLTCVFLVFQKFLPLTYGNKDLTEEEVESLRWFESWGFLVQGKMIA